MLGERIKKLRKDKKVTQEELGKKINVTKVSISGYENGIRNPDTETLQKIAEFFGVTTDYLLGRSDNPEPTDKKEAINSAFYKYENLTDEEKEFLDLQLELFRDMKKKKNK